MRRAQRDPQETITERTPVSKTTRTRAKVRQSRALGIPLTPKAARYLEKRPYGPGQHGRTKRKSDSDYAVRLREKQRLRAQYGIREKQLVIAFKEARRQDGLTGENLVELLEMRLDALVLRDAGRSPPADGPPCFTLRTRLADTLRRLDDPAHTMPLADLVERQAARALTITAAAGIAVPDRFFALLRTAGLSFDPLPLPDHHDFRDGALTGLRTHLVLITEKDAVKCAGIEALRRDPRIWVAPLVAAVDEALFDLVEARLGPLRKASHGSSTA